jgi:hypothetical protein
MGLFTKHPPPAAPVMGPDAIRPVNEQAAGAIERALGQLGPVVHPDDPARSVSFAAGGPPVWSVGFVAVPGPRPYTLLVTYGLSYTVSPEPARSHVRYELSIAVPHDEPASPWADAFLRAQAHYLLVQHAELAVGECVPFRGVPITKLAFAPDYHATLPDTSLVGILVAQDPVIPMIRADAGDIEVRRLVGIDQLEIDRAVTWDPPAFLEEVRRLDPLLLTSPRRATYMPQLAAAIEPRAERDGSTVEGVLLDLRWQQIQRTVRIELPQGPAAQRVLAALRGRIGHGRKLIGYSTLAPPITFSPGPAGMEISPTGLELAGELTTPPIAMVVDALVAGAPYVELGLQPPPPARARVLFFERVKDVVRVHEMDILKMNKELTKLLDEAHATAALEDQVPATERDADQAALGALVRTLRFARTPDQSAIEAMIKALSRG